jgi:serine/threonine protein kinase
LVVELCEGGELGRYVQKNSPLPEPTIKQIMLKLIDALHYLHKMGTVLVPFSFHRGSCLFLDIVHRDLKLENILLKTIPTSNTDNFDIRVDLSLSLLKLNRISFQVTDFGLSSKQTITSTESLLQDYCGTLL